MRRKVIKDKTNFFKYIVFPDKSLPNIGWKIHISAQYANHNQILSIVSKYCLQNKQNFKYIFLKRNFLRSISKNANRLSSGKFITIYPEDKKSAKNIIQDLYKLLRHFKGPSILTDRSYKQSIVHYRYGTILFTKDNEESYEEERKINSHKPENIKDLFPGVANYLGTKLRGYEVQTAIIQTNFGGIYVAKKNNKFFVVKEARPFLSDNSNSPISYRKNEINIITKSASNKFFPKFIEYFWIQKHFFSIFSFHNFPNLSFWKNKINFIYPWNTQTGVKKQNEKLLLKLINAIILLLSEAQQQKIILNDIKLTNFVWSGEELLMVDLEHAFFENQRSLYIFDLFNKKPKKVDYTKDIHNCGYMIADIISGSSVFQNKFTNKKRVLDFFLDFSLSNNIDSLLVTRVWWLLNVKNKKLEFIPKRVNLKLFKKNIKLKKYKFLGYNKFKKINFQEYIMNNGPSNKEDKILWKKLNFAINTFDSQKEVEKIIDDFAQSRIKIIKGYKLFQTQEGYFSPYLLNGSARIIFFLLMYKKKFNSEKYDKLIMELSVPLKNKYILKSSFMFGISGIIFILLLIYPVFNDETIIEIVEQQRQLLDFFYLPKKQTYFDYMGDLLKQEDQNLVSKITNLFSEI